ncbi:unnamed protein product, partial [Iphiclides podalirius]
MAHLWTANHRGGSDGEFGVRRRGLPTEGGLRLCGTREICDVLEDYSGRLRETLSRCKADQGALYDAYQKSGQLVRDMKGKQQQTEERNRQLIESLQEKVNASNEHQAQLLQYLTAAKQRAEEELAAVHRQSDQIATTNAQLRRDLDRQADSLARKDEIIMNIREEMKRAVEEYNHQCAEARDTITKLENEVREAKEAYATVKGELSVKEELARVVCGERDAFKARVAALEEARTQLTATSEALKLQLTEACAAKAAIEQNFERIMEENNRLEKEMFEYIQQLTNAKQQVQELQMQLSMLEKDKVEIASELRELLNVSNEKTIKIDELVAEEKLLKEKINEIEDAFKRYRETSDDKMSKMATELQEKEKEIDSKADTINLLMSEVKTGTDARSRLEGTVQKLKKEIEVERDAGAERERKMGKQIEQLEATVRDKEDELSKQMSIILDMRNEKERLQDKIQGMQQTIDNIQKELTGRAPPPSSDPPEMDDNAVMLTPSHKKTNKSPQQIKAPPSPMLPKKPGLVDPKQLDSMIFSLFSDSSMESDALDVTEVERRFAALSRGERVPPTSLAALKRRAPLQPKHTPPISLSQVKNDLKNRERTFFKHKRITMDRGKMSSTGRGAKSKAPQHPQDIFALGSKSTVVVSRDSEKRNIHKPSTSGVERKRESSAFGSQPPSKRSRIGSPAETVGGTSLDVEPIDLVPNVLQALDTHNSDKLLGLLTGSIRLLKSQRSKPDIILCMSMLYLTKIRPNMFAHETVTQSLCTLLKREQGAAFKSKGNPLVFVLACNMLYAGHKDSTSWPDTFIKVYIEDALNERWWVDCSWCKCLVENIVTAFSTKQPPPHLIPSDNTLGSGSPLMGSTDEDADNTELEYSVFPRYTSSYETVEALVLEAIKEQIQRRTAPDTIGKGFLKLLSATCGFPEIRMIAASRLEAWLHSGKLWRAAQELLAHVCANASAAGPSAARDHEVLAQLARMRLKTKPLQVAYQSCLREMVSESPALLRSVVTHTIYNELSNARSPNNMAVLAALIHAQPQLVPAAIAETYQELLFRADDYLRPMRAMMRECVRAARSETQALLPLAAALAAPPQHDPPAEIRERAFQSLADLFCCCCAVTAAHSKHAPDYRAQLCALQQHALGWLLDTAVPVYRPARHDFQHALNKIMFVEPAEAYSKADNWPPESERALTYRLCCEAPLPQNTLLRLIFIGLSKEIPVSPAEVFELVEQLVRRACALPAEELPLQVDKLEIADYIFQLCQFHPPDNITLPAGYSPPALAITSLYWRGWMLLTMLAAHNPQGFAERAAATYPTLRALIEMCITGKPSIEWNANSAAETERAEAERATILQLETHLATASNAKLPITEHSSRLLSQLTVLEPLGPARRPPSGVADALAALSTQLRLGRLLCRQPALLLQLVERHGTRRAMPWLHQLLRHDQLELSVLPVQCLCEFLSAGGAGGAGGGGGAGGEAGKAGELCAHLRRTLASEEGARAVLQYYMQRLSHAHAPTRAAANRGLKLVLSQTEDTAEMDYNADVSPDEWLGLLWSLRHWEAVRGEAVARVRAACLVECAPRHLAAYLAFLADHVAATPDHDHTDLVLDLSHVLMERTTVTGCVLPQVGSREAPRDERHLAQHRALYSFTRILHAHLRQVIRTGVEEDEEEDPEAWGGAERVLLQWSGGRRAKVHVVLMHAHLKLLCYGPSIYDTNQEMYSWLQSMWVGGEASAWGEGGEALLPDWLRLHLVRSARPPLLEAGLRALPAHKLALFIQTFGMPVPSMSALLSALDACPAGAVVRLGVERAYMAQLLTVQRARGATGGAAFAAALHLQQPQLPPDDTLFAEEPLPEEGPSAWDTVSAVPRLEPDHVLGLLSAVFDADDCRFDVDTACTQLYALIAEEGGRGEEGPYTRAACTLLRSVAPHALLRRPAHAAALLRTLHAARARALPEIARALVSGGKWLTGPVGELVLAAAGGACDTPPAPSLPPAATRDQLIAALEATSPSSLEAVGNHIIETQDTQLVVEVISILLEKSQDGHYETKVKCESEIEEEASAHVFSRRGLGCGLLLDWLSELQRETLGRQMQLMFVAGGAPWRPLLVTLLAHRASWRTLHSCLTALLQPNKGWSASAVLDFAETLAGSPRVWQGRDRATPKHYEPEDTLSLSHGQLEVLIGYMGAEGAGCGDAEGARRRAEARLPLLLRCCGAPHALLAAALAAAERHPLLLLLLYMKVPKVVRLVRECGEREACGGAGAVAAAERAVGRELARAARASTSATDRVSHALLTALAATHAHSKDLTQRAWRISSLARALWSRVGGAGARALPLCGALVRGLRAEGARHAPHAHLLAALEVLPDDELLADAASEELHEILECFLQIMRQTAGGGGRGGDGGSLSQRVAALLRRYAAARPQRAAALMHAHRDTIASLPALASVSAGDTSAPASATPPPHALLALQRRIAPPDELTAHLQEVEAWGVRRGGAWGGRGSAATLLRAIAPLAAAPHAPLRTAALSLLAKLLPAAPDPAPGLQAIMECLDSNQPEVAQSALDKMAELIVGVQEHAGRILARVFELGLRSRLPAELCIARCVAAINLQRGC